MRNPAKQLAARRLGGHNGSDEKKLTQALNQPGLPT
jgi:hypothetical protein